MKTCLRTLRTHSLPALALAVAPLLAACSANIDEPRDERAAPTEGARVRADEAPTGVAEGAATGEREAPPADGAAAASAASEPPAEVTPGADATLAGGCGADAVASGGWVGDAIAVQSGTFVVEFLAYPKSAPEAYPPTVDAVVGLSRGLAASSADLGPIVRFNAEGRVDARDGDAYAADAFVQYRTDAPYLVRMTVDLAAGRYSVAVKENTQRGTPLTAIATDYAFRSDPANAGALDTLARHLEGASGALSVCSVAVTPSGARVAQRP